MEIKDKKALFDYNISETLEAGIVLTGLEIKAIRAGKISMTGSYAKIINGELFWLGGNFNYPGLDPARIKKLLIHKKELDRLRGKIDEQGFTLVPIKIYLRNGYAKMELGLGRGKKVFDKRETIKKRTVEREAARRVKQY